MAEKEKERLFPIFRIGALIKTNKREITAFTRGKGLLKNTTFVTLPPGSIMMYLGSNYEPYPRIEFVDNHQLEIISEKVESVLAHHFLFREEVIKILDDTIELRDDLDYAHRRDDGGGGGDDNDDKRQQ